MIQKSLLRKKNFFLLMGYQLCAGLADKMVQFVIPWLVYDLTGSATQMVFTFGISMAPHLMFSLFGGTLVDYFDRRKLLLVSTFLNTVIVFIFSLFILNFNVMLDVDLICILCFLISTFNAFDASLVDYFEKKEFVSVNSTIEVMLSLCNTFGPLITGGFIVIFGAKQTLFIAAIVYLASYILIKLSKPMAKFSLCKSFSGLGELLYENVQLTKAGLAYIFRSKNPILLSLAMTVSVNLILGTNNLIAGTKDILVTFIVRESLRVNIELFSSIISFVSLMALIVIAFIANKLKRIQPFTIMTSVLLVVALSSVVIGCSEDKIFILIFYCVTIVAESLYKIFAKAFRQTIVPPEMMGRVAGITRSLVYCASAGGAFLAGFVLNIISARVFFIIGGVLIFLISIISLSLKRNYEKIKYEVV